MIWEKNTLYILSNLSRIFILHIRLLIKPLDTKIPHTIKTCKVINNFGSKESEIGVRDISEAVIVTHIKILLLTQTKHIY